MLGNCLVVQNVERKNFQLQKIYQMRAVPPSMWCRTAKLEGFQIFQFGHIVQSIHISHIWKNWTLKVKAWTLKASHRQDCTASTRVPLTTNRGRTIYPFNRLIFYSCSRKSSSQNLYGQKNVASPLYSKNLDYKNYIRLPKNLTDSSNPTL